MYSPNIHSLLAQPHVDELTRTAATSRSHPSTARRPRRVQGTPGARPTAHRSASRFVRHYAEMVAVMFAGMHYRGHAWRLNIEMAASMMIPTVAVMAVLWSGIAKRA